MCAAGRLVDGTALTVRLAIVTDLMGATATGWLTGTASMGAATGGWFTGTELDKGL